MQLIIMLFTVFSILIPIGMGIARYSFLEKEAKWLLYMLIPVASNQFLSVWWIYYVEPNNLPFYHFFILMETVFLSWIFYSYMKRARFRWIILVLTIGFSVFFVGQFVIDIDLLFTYPVYTRSIEGVILLIYAGAYFVDIYKRQEVMYLQKTSGFWIGGGVILYFTSNLVLFVFSEVIFAQQLDIYQSIWAIHGILTFLLYLSFTIALSCKKAEIIS